jgi:tetratricopeptide (TPR) repeat protein
MGKKVRMGTASRGLTCIVVSLTNFVFAAACIPRANAQTANFVPATRPNMNVSVRELRIPPKAEHEYQQGLKRLLKRDPGGSLVHFAAAIEKYPGYYEVYYHKGMAEMALNKNDEALQSFQRAIDLSDGHYTRAEFGYGLILCREGRTEEAERIVRHGLQADPNSSDGHVVLGYVLLKLNRLDEAEKNAHEALDLNDPNSAKAFLVLADVDAARKNYWGRVQDLDAYLKRFPHDPYKSVLQTARNVTRKIAISIDANSPKTTAQLQQKNEAP